MGEVKEKRVTLIDGYTKLDGMIGVKTSGESIGFWSENFGTLLTNSLVTADGRTIGESNRAELHAMLDAWLDKTWGDDNEQ